MLGVAHACVQRPQKDLGFLLYALNFIRLRQDLSLNMEQGCAQQTPVTLLPQCPQDSGCRCPCSASLSFLFFPFLLIQLLRFGMRLFMLTELVFFPPSPSSQPSSSLFNGQRSVQCPYFNLCFLRHYYQNETH